MPLLERFFHGADRPSALSLEARSLSRHALRAMAFAQAARLRDLGVRPGDTLGLWAHGSLETLVALLANLAHGVVTVPLNPALGERELAHILGDCAPRALLGRSPRALPSELSSIEIALDLQCSTVIDTELRGPHESALVLYTSGTTGSPKGAVLTRDNLASNLDALASAWQWTADDTLTHALPLFHVHGLVLGVLGPLHVGSGLDLLSRFDPELVLQALDRGATMFFGVPTMYHRLAERAEGDGSLARALGRPRLLVSGSAALSAREHRRIEAVSGRGVIERYGMTETLINTSVRASEGPRAGYVGGALEGVEVKLVDDQRQSLELWDDASPGEIAVRSRGVFAGYLKRPEATEAVRDREGWFYTGDIATRAPDGCLRVLGRRATDLIKTGGFKVGAGEVEAALMEHPRVREAAVFGIADEDLGERIEAVVALTEGSPVAPESLCDFVAASLCPHKRPRKLRVVDALPRNAMGKVLKGALREGSR